MRRGEQISATHTVTDGAWRWSHQLPEAMRVWGRSTQALGDFL